MHRKNKETALQGKRRKEQASKFFLPLPVLQSISPLSEDHSREQAGRTEMWFTEFHPQHYKTGYRRLRDNSLIETTGRIM